MSPELAAKVESKVAKYGDNAEQVEKFNKSVSILFAWLQGTIDMVRTIATLRAI